MPANFSRDQLPLRCKTGDCHPFSAAILEPYPARALKIMLAPPNQMIVIKFSPRKLSFTWNCGGPILVFRLLARAEHAPGFRQPLTETEIYKLAIEAILGRAPPDGNNPNPASH
jgi:hypothetical protein